MEGRRLWIYETYGHVYDVYVKGKDVLAVNENKLLLLNEEDYKVLYQAPFGLTCVKPMEFELVLGMEGKALLFLGEEESKVDLEYGVNDCMPKGNKVAVGLCCNGMALVEDGEVKWHLETDNHVYSVDWYGDVIIGAGFDGFLYAVGEEGKVLHKLPLAENVNVARVCGDLIAVGTFEPGQLYLLKYDKNNGFQMVWGKRDFFDVRALAWRNDCEYLFVADWDGTVEIYDRLGNIALKGVGPRSMESAHWNGDYVALGGWGRIELYEIKESSSE
ncbi:hypothetical protein IPA_03275 [Ignicoccus pacificus DSM 13166]|uniref:Anaphase-promoting complex subunit 4-like WD40 domain-containing protein n=1 Tax=Ignicoccus pacificus DSM 13166 TaxID=940294 RepID=A0A977KAW4_9CREN|nr:hypothetical protein IPA_03275 [Ignicoccus pacificus DSM 13166]